MTLRLSIQPQKGCNLREDISIHRTNLKYCGKSPKIRFTPTFIFCSPICPNICAVLVLWKYILDFEKWFFSFDLSNMQIFTVDITRVVWPHVTNILDLRYFCQHNPLFYHLNLIPCHYWSWQRNVYFLVNIFVRHTLPMSKSNIKTDRFSNDRYDKIYWASSFLKDKRVVKKLLSKFPCVFVLFYLETNSKSGKIYLQATMKYVWCAYLSPPFIGINHYNL